MLKHFETASRRHEEITKEAFFVPAAKAIGKGVKALGGWAKKNPGKASTVGLTAGFAPMDVADAAKRVSQAKSLGKHKGNIAKTFTVGPVY